MRTRLRFPKHESMDVIRSLRECGVSDVGANQHNQAKKRKGKKEGKDQEEEEDKKEGRRCSRQEKGEHSLLPTKQRGTQKGKALCWLAS